MTSFEEIKAGKTPSRCFLNDTISAVNYEYPVLDVGGGHDFSYHRFLDTDLDHTVSTNLPRVDNVDVVADAESTFPFADESFRTVLCFNLLEHLYRYDVTIEEIERVLKPSGKVLVGVPFLHRIHGDPQDHTRFTEHRLRCDFGSFSDVQIEALDPGPLSAAVNMTLPIFQFNLVQYAVWRTSKALDTVVNTINDILEGCFPLYYVLVATK